MKVEREVGSDFIFVYLKIVYWNLIMFIVVREGGLLERGNTFYFDFGIKRRMFLLALLDLISIICM